MSPGNKHAEALLDCYRQMDPDFDKKPPKSYFVIKPKEHYCYTPGWFSRVWNRVKPGDEWWCECGKGYRSHLDRCYEGDIHSWIEIK